MGPGLTANESFPILGIVDAMYWPSNLENAWAKYMGRRQNKAQFKIHIFHIFRSPRIKGGQTKFRSALIMHHLLHIIHSLSSIMSTSIIIQDHSSSLTYDSSQFILVVPCCSNSFPTPGALPLDRTRLVGFTCRFFTRSDEKTSGCSIHESLDPRVWSLDMSSVTPFFEAVKLESPPNIDMCSGQKMFLPIIMCSFRSKGTPTIRK